MELNTTSLSEIMTTELITVGPKATLTEVDQIFKSNSFHHIPVVNQNNKILGIISKSDYLVLCDSMMLFKKKSTESKNQRFFSSLLAEEVMSQSISYLYPEDKLSAAADLFGENRFHSIPVVNKDGLLKGLVTTFDMIRYAFPKSSPVQSA